MVKILIERSKNELLLSQKIFEISDNESLKENLEIDENITFYNAVISHAYYSIFYSTKGLLLTKGIKTESPNIHKKTMEEFEKNFVKTGILDMNLFEIYKKIVIKADTLLDIFKEEKWKRGNFTYKTHSQENKEPADDSIKNAKLFVSNIIHIIENKDDLK
jgi:uncharacterized protein (UPF0332 family)